MRKTIFTVTRKYKTVYFFSSQRLKMRIQNIKNNLQDMKDSYDPKEVESKWYDFWEQNGYFKPKKELTGNANSEKFVIVLPPPNITGSLHIGHTLTIAIQDSLVRFKRMKNCATLYIPGTDHAGIATQTVVEKMLYKKENKIRQDFGREEFLKKIYEWKDLHGHIIKNQIKRVGASVDWSREYFTMDENLSVAVKEAFIKFFESGLIYRDNRLVAWCPFLKTALSDIEVNAEEIKKPTKIKIPGFQHSVEVGVLIKFFYPVKDSEDKIEVATTRIETMLGDVAVAVNPKDKRYARFIGKELVHPFIKNRKLFVIADEYVDMDFGTGAVKVTPAHDKNDFEIMKRHNLDSINIFTLDGYINENGGELFQGQHRFECRFKIQEELKKLKLLSDKVPNVMSLPICSRTNDIIEYMLIPQWYVDCSKLAQEAIRVVKDKELKILPSHHNQMWFYWLENIKDWCISRQLWWGHRIPAYKVILKDMNTKEVPNEKRESAMHNNQTQDHRSSFIGNCNKGNSVAISSPNSSQIKEEKWVVGRNYEEAYNNALKITDGQEFTLEQDEDVLDTWFSSALVPFSALGWPNETEDFHAYFPNTLLETGQDILFFWVSRMVMVSLHLTKKLPFDTIYLHAMIRDSKGEKMSKSKGNVIDPLDIIEGITLEKLHQKLYEGNLPEKEIKRAIELQKKEFPNGISECGTDALRFGLLTYLKQGRNVNLDINRIVAYRHFCNKLWNAVKFFLKAIPKNYDNINTLIGQPDLVHSLEWEDKWILHKLNVFIKAANDNFESYNFSEVAFAAYNFWLYELCDIYLELIKSRIYVETTSNEVKDIKKIEKEITNNVNGNVGETKDEMIQADANKNINDNQTHWESANKAAKTLHACMDWGLRLLHPLSPFVTEELYQKISTEPEKYDSVSIAPYPNYVTLWENEKINEQMNTFMDIVKHFRSFISTLEIPPKSKLHCFIAAKEKEDEQFIRQVKSKIEILAKLTSLEIINYNVDELSDTLKSQLKKCLKDIISHKFIIYVQSSEEYLTPLLKTMKNKQTKMQASLDSYNKKINDPNYEKKVPEQVRNMYKEKVQQLMSQISGTQHIIKEIEECLK